MMLLIAQCLSHHSKNPRYGTSISLECQKRATTLRTVLGRIRDTDFTRTRRALSQKDSATAVAKVRNSRKQEAGQPLYPHGTWSSQSHLQTTGFQTPASIARKRGLPSILVSCKKSTLLGSGAGIPATFDTMVNDAPPSEADANFGLIPVPSLFGMK
jgi:hypothetical protein